jgi:hypothetical protein
VVNVYVGSNPGDVVVSATSGSVECRATAQVATIRPPSTGDAGLASRNGNDGSLVTPIAIVAGLLLSLALVARRSRNLA